MNIETSYQKNVVLFKLNGRIDLEQISLLESTFGEHLDKGYTRFILNMVDVRDISSSGLGKILSMFKRLELSNGRLALSDLSAVSEYVLDLAGLADVFPTYRSDEQALASFG
ncbi:MAG: STAS domain-containing protein [Leptospiraceae bacterium]|nr:STAS domain-containing protein [Leptospiraceae bacterium]